MGKSDSLDDDLLAAYDSGELEFIHPSPEQLAKIKNTARATFIKDRRINIRLSTPDLMDIQATSLEEGVPYQTLIASIIHKYVTGRLVEKPSRRTIKAGSETRRSP